MATRVHPKQLGKGTRFFAHNPEAPPTCPLKSCEGESPEHRRLKFEVYRAARRVKGWGAEIEVPAPEPDPLTGRPVVVDVVAKRRDPRLQLIQRHGIQGWEVQLQPRDEGVALNRHEHRSRFLNRCAWVTASHPAWSEQLPWYRLAPKTDEHPDLVIEGVVRRHYYEDPGRGSDYVTVDPFPHDQMVRSVLAGAMWAEGVGWQLNGSGGDAPRKRVRRRTREALRGRVAEYCSRMAALPPETRDWTEDVWLKLAVSADDKVAHKEPLSALERTALARIPAPQLFRATEAVLEPVGGYDPLGAPAPCVLCGELVVVTVAREFPMHHRCAWQLRTRGSLAPVSK